MNWVPDPQFAPTLHRIIIREAMRLRDRLSHKTVDLRGDHERRGILGSGAAARHAWSVWRDELETLPEMMRHEALSLLNEHGARLNAQTAAWLADALEQHMDDLVTGLSRESAALFPPRGFMTELKELFGRLKVRVRTDLQIEAQRSALSGSGRVDDLVPLLRKSALLEDLPAAIRDAGVSGKPLALLFLDLDGFKALNDTHGHDAGDEALRSFAERLKGALGDRGTAYRYGGDEFAVLATACNRAEAESLAESLRAATISETVTAQNVRLGVSIGFAIWNDGETAEALLKAADEAMYRDKHARRVTSSQE